MLVKKTITEMPAPMNAMEHYLSQILIRLDEMNEARKPVVTTIVPEKTENKGGEKINEPRPTRSKSKK